MEYFRNEQRRTFYHFAESLDQHGLEVTYRSNIAFNHPPLVAHYLELIYQLSQRPWFEQNRLDFPFLLRLPAIVADFGSVLVLLRERKKSPQLRIPNWALILFALSPVSVMVSGFHGNTDFLMVLFCCSRLTRAPVKTRFSAGCFSPLVARSKSFRCSFSDLFLLLELPPQIASVSRPAGSCFLYFMERSTAEVSSHLRKKRSVLW
jgi:Gpi18-like mannosyltransferase